MASSDLHKFRPKTVDHIGIMVKDCEKVIEHWEQVLGIGPWEIRDVDSTTSEGKTVTTRLAFTYLGGLLMALVQPPEGSSEFLDTHGEGLHHLGFFVDDVDVEVANLVEQGVKIISHNKGRSAHLDIGGPGGVIYEVMKESNYLQVPRNI